MEQLSSNSSAAAILNPLLHSFSARFGASVKPRIFRAPGRVNLIGEHTDYNDGFVMPAAIDLSVYVQVWSREDRRLEIQSENFADQIEFDLDQPHPQRRGHWSDYIVGVAVTLERAGH